MKNNIKLNRIQTALLVALLTIGMTGNVMGGTFTATQNGNWNLAATWGKTGTNYPKLSSDTVTIPASITVTLSSGSATCRNLTLNPSSITNLSISGNTTILYIYGTLLGTNTSSSNPIITTSGTSRIKFTGSSNRALFGNTWSDEVGNWNCDVSLTDGTNYGTGTASTAIKMANLSVLAGTFIVNNDLRINAGGSIIDKGNLIVTGNIGAQTTVVTTYCSSINIDGGYLTVEGDYLNASSITIGGTLIIKKTTSSSLISYPIGTNFSYGSGSYVQYDSGTAGTITTGAELSQTGSIDASVIVNSLVTLQNNTVMGSDLTINSGGVLTVPSGVDLTVTGATNLNASQCLVLKSSTGTRPVSASFIDIGGVTDFTDDGSGNGTGMMMELAVTGHKTTKIDGRTWYVASPVSNATSAALNVGVNSNLWYWDQNLIAYTKITNTTTYLTPAGRGYDFICSADNTFNFIGTPNSGPVAITGIPRPASSSNASRGFYLLGNPYPSSLDWSLVTTTNMYASIAYRTANPSNIMVYDYWNPVSGGTNINQYGAVSSKIPPMQAVWVKVNGDGNVGDIFLDNSARVHNTDATSNFLKSATITPDRFKLALFGNGNKDEIIIAQADTAHDDIDRFDQTKSFANVASQAEFYVHAPTGEKLVIDAVKPITTAKDFPLLINIGQAGSYKFTADLSQSYTTNKITLEDKVTGIVQDLSTNPDYSFDSGIVKDSARFVVHYNPIASVQTPQTPETPTSISLDKGEKIQIYSYNGIVHINNAELGSTIFIYDILGKTIYSGKVASDSEIIYSINGDGCYVAKIINEHYIKTQKIYLNKK
jgi:hypothetical protein